MRAFIIPLLLILLPTLIYGIVMHYHKKKPLPRSLTYIFVLLLLLFAMLVLHEAFYRETIAPHTPYVAPRLDGDTIAPATTR
ncbi:MAG: hypothetical protein GDA54_01410 [Alphaproteobacteria bacterium GM7ARS4]|nr:hypothetical protein [Alphaproteobacteria bacterium GM7ARS4]